MINATELANDVATFLRGEVEAADDGTRVQLLLPAEYPDCDAVSVFVEQLADGAFSVTDQAQGDSYLIGYLGSRAAAEKAERIATRFDVSFLDGRVTTRSDGASLPELCWRVAQASAAIAEGATFVPPAPTEKRTFTDVVTNELARLAVTVKYDYAIEGASGHEHRASVFVTETEAVLEPISGRKAWERAERVYAQFGDLRGTNGYRLLAVLDDREKDVTQQQKLLSQVGTVGRWSKADEWLESLSIQVPR